MFIRPCYRRKDGRRHAYWALVESYRSERGPRQRTVAYLGQLDEAGRLGVRRAAQGNQKPAQQQLQLREGDSPAPEWVEVDASAVRVENQLAFGGPWLALEIIRKLRLHDFLKRTIPPGKEAIPWSLMAQVLVVCRFCNPSSELHIAEHYYRSTAISELLGVPPENVYDERLYRALDALLPHKEELEKHLKNRLGELFGLKLLRAFRNGGAGNKSRRSKLAAHICASLRGREDGGFSPIFLLHREAEECAAIWNCGPKSVVEC